MDRDAVRDLMWRNAGLFRTREKLLEAVETLERASASSVVSNGGGQRGTAIC